MVEDFIVQALTHPNPVFEPLRRIDFPLIKYKPGSSVISNELIDQVINEQFEEEAAEYIKISPCSAACS